MSTIAVHKIASVTRGLVTGRQVSISRSPRAESGVLLVVEALTEKSVYDSLELVGGRMAKITRGDVLVGALGRRRALKGFVGDVPETITSGDVLHVLNLGGVIGRCTSAFSDVGPALEVQVHGMVVDAEGRGRSITEGAIGPAETLVGRAPVILISGTCMNAGKTRAACEIIAKLAQRRYRVAALKLSGVACQRDPLNMLDHGAFAALSFLDAGLPSTVGLETLAPMARGLLNRLEQEQPDALVIEMGDGIIGEYGVDSLLADQPFMARVKAHVLCANDLVGAYGAARYLAERAVPLHLFSGPVTDNEVGAQYLARTLGVPAHNARQDADRLGRAVERLVFG